MNPGAVAGFRGCPDGPGGSLPRMAVSRILWRGSFSWKIQGAGPGLKPFRPEHEESSDWLLLPAGTC